MKKILYVIIMLLFSANTFSAPSISSTSGTFTNGSAVTISGSSFGTKSPAAPVYWSNYDSETTGNDPVGWTQINGSTTVETTRAYSGAKALETVCDNYSSDYNQYTKDLGVDFVDSVLVKFKLYIEHTGTLTYQYKGWRISSEPDAYSTDGTKRIYFYNNWWYGTGESTRWGNIGTPSIRTTNNSYNFGPADDHFDIGAWQDISNIFILGDDDTANGSFYNMKNCQVSSSGSGIEMKEAADNDYVHHFNLQTSFVSQEDSYVGSKIYYDDFYIDNTLARVEIGNASTYSACTASEVQIPTSWGPTSIGITVNTGALGDGTQYLYVIDSDNDPNASGEQITLGAGGADTDPPYTAGWSPAKSETDVVPSVDMVIEVYDAGDGVDRETIEWDVEGTVHCWETKSADCDSGSGVKDLTTSGTAAHYTVTYNPGSNFSYDQEVNWTFDVSDLAGTPNAMSQDSGLFTIQSEPSSTNGPITIGGETKITIGNDIELRLD